MNTKILIMKTVLYSLSLILLMNCSEKKEVKLIELSADNSFNVALNVPVDYAKVSGKSIEEYVDVTLKNAEKAVEAIKQIKTPTFENTVVEGDRITSELSKASNNAFMLYWVSPDSLVRAKGLEGYQKLSSYFTSMGSDNKLFKQYLTFSESEEYKQLKAHRKRLVDDVIENFKQSGVNLNAEDLEKYKKLIDEINNLTTQYSTNMNTANEVLVLDENGAKGLPEAFKEKYKKDKGYEIPVQNSTSAPVMSNATSSDVRKAFTTKYSNRGADKNLSLIHI